MHGKKMNPEKNMSIIWGQYFCALFMAGDIIFPIFFKESQISPVIIKKLSALRAMCGVLFLLSKKANALMLNMYPALMFENIMHWHDCDCA